ncbi:MAG: hypothetical protein JW808_06330 [Victivallales bacterium]|nr:hypothetical protein [Victivallales bacterium]
MKNEKDNPEDDLQIHSVPKDDNDLEPEEEHENSSFEEVPLGSILPILEDTSLDLEALSEDPSDTPGIPQMETDGNAGEEQETPETTDQAISKEPAARHNPASILDLIKAKAPESPEIVSKNQDLDTQIEGKSLEEVLKIPQRKEEEWHKSKKAEEDLLQRAAAAKRRQKKLFIATPLIIMAGGVLCFYIILPTFNPPPETEPIRLPRRQRPFDPEKLTIDPDLKDEVELQKFLDIADNFIAEEKFNLAEKVLRKILPTSWEKNEILKKIALCSEKLGDNDAAIEAYSQILSKDYSGDAELPLKVASMLKEKQKYKEILDIIGPLSQQFATNTQIQIILLDTYSQLGMEDMMFNAMRKINKQFLSEQQIRLMGTKLLEENDTAEAFNVFLFLGQNFNDINSLYEASKIAPTRELEITILNQLVGKTIGSPKRNHFSMLLAKALLAEGRKADSMRALSAIRAEDLNYQDSLDFLRLLCEYDDSSRLADACERIVEKNFLENIKVQEEVRNNLLSKNQNQVVDKIFKDLLAKYPERPVQNYMVASVAHSHEIKSRYLNKALSIDPDFFEANLEMGKLMLDAGDLENAAASFDRCIRSRPSDLNTRYWATAVALRASKDYKPLMEYQNFLAKNRIPEPEQLKLMLPLAQTLEDDSESTRILSEMAQFEELKDFSVTQTIRTKLIYGKLMDTDFHNVSAQDVKLYRILFLIGEGRLNDVMMLPTLKEEFPEFWKVFIAWRRDMSGWEKNSETLIKKNNNFPPYRISAELWLSIMAPAEAERQAVLIGYENRPLLYLMIAEKYRKDGNRIKASISYQTALKSPPPNIYKKVIEHLKDN